jgi:hypothetical protein
MIYKAVARNVLFVAMGQIRVLSGARQFARTIVFMKFETASPYYSASPRLVAGSRLTDN